MVAIVSGILMLSTIGFAAADLARTAMVREAPPMDPVRLTASAAGAKAVVRTATQRARAVERGSYRATIQSRALAASTRRAARHMATARSLWRLQYGILADQETIDALAERYHVSVDELVRWNPRLRTEHPAAGERLIVYRFDPSNPPSSAGRANRGRLHHGVPMPEGPAWNTRDPARAWGTEIMIDALVRGFEHVASTFPDTHPIFIGDLSRRRGGSFRPHKSHQSGRDIDASYYDTSDPPRTADRFVHMSRSTLDVARQWELFGYWIRNDEVEHIFVDRRLIPVLRRHAATVESEEIIERAFGRRALITHEPGHLNHFHARFRCADHDPRCE